jgi:hypothetical protein
LVGDGGLARLAETTVDITNRAAESNRIASALSRFGDGQKNGYDSAAMRSQRQELALKHVDTSGKGLEVGPAFQPLAPRSDGFDITILDHASTAEIRQKYADLGLDQDGLDRIEDVDCVWTGGRYSETPGLVPPYDYIIASHVIEHTTDPIGFLLDLAELLSERGRIALVVPDKRFCFDHHRPVSTTGAILDAHLHPLNLHTPGAVFDHFAHHVTRDHAIVWGDHDPDGDFEFTYSLEQAWSEAQQAMRTDDYMDIHRWAFTPSSLAFALASLRCGGWLDDLVVIASHETVGCEFFLTIGRGDAPYRGKIRQLQSKMWLEEQSSQ